VPALQFQVRLPLRLNFLVRPEPGLAASSLGERVRAEIQEEAPDLAVYDVRTMEQRLATQTEHGRFEVLLVSLFTFIALVLAIIGVYGVISYGVAQRTREIGIRMALGADRRDVLRLVVLRGTARAALGLGIGLVAVLLLRGWLEELMYGTSAMDPVILIGTSVLLLAVTAVASFVPARRASRLEPVRGLRSE
jgi:ABC-type antimicrobial peptide transport system permease subunit